MAGSGRSDNRSVAAECLVEACARRREPGVGCPTCYHTFVKIKTSVYLDQEQVERLKRAAEAAGRSEADLIREGVDLVLLRTPRAPRTREWPSFDSGDPRFAVDAEEHLRSAYER
ncbi:ribbon-helix-helix protein, CopG family [Nocardia farcinica]|nr:ribbon-helix-helix protein, CopG family [Nocardia farcinica]